MSDETVASFIEQMVRKTSVPGSWEAACRVSDNPVTVAAWDR